MHPLTQVWWTRFINRTDGTLRRGGDGWRFTTTPLTKQEMSDALRLKQSLGIYAVDTKGMSRWLCLDADTDKGRAALADTAAALNPDTTLFEISRRGAHLWWFCPPTPWQRVRAVGQSLIAKQGIDCEVFPKSAGRNGVRLPLTRHPKTGDVYPVIDPLTGAIREPVDLLHLVIEPLPQLTMVELQRAERHTAETNHRAFAALWDEVTQFTRLRQYGPERAIGLCPFHDDRHPSFSLLGGFWRCWAGCGEGGIGAFRSLVKQRGWRDTI
jgi:hypothetical protein